MRFATVVLLIAVASLTVLGQTPPSLRIETEVPGLPSELFYGNVKVRPLRLRPGTNIPITISDSDFFVSQQYVDFFSRFPDQSGFDFWVNQIAGCGTNAGCIDGQRANTSGAFFLSIEFQETGYLVYRVHTTSFGTTFATLPRYKDFMPNTRAVGKNVVVGPGNWQATLEANKTAFLNAWVTGPDFVAAYPANMSNQEYVNKLVATAGVTSGEVNGSALVSGLDNSTETRATVLRKIAESAAVNLKEKNRAFVLMQYLGYLRRDPDQAGFDFWLGKLNNHGGDFHSAEMVKSFIVSGEYKDRF